MGYIKRGVKNMKKIRLIRAKMNDDRIVKMMLKSDYEFNIISEAYNVKNCLTLEIKGKTYQEKRNFLADLAINYQFFLTLDCDIDFGLLELADISGWFENKAKLFGLTKEFRENAII